jgi:Family of unknown function (DUF6088)
VKRIASARPIGGPTRRVDHDLPLVGSLPCRPNIPGMLSPDIKKVAAALAGKHRIRLQPAGAYATNLLGLSEQVPAKVVLLTDGPSRTVKIGRQATLPVAAKIPVRRKNFAMETLGNRSDQTIAEVSRFSLPVGRDTLC